MFMCFSNKKQFILLIETVLNKFMLYVIPGCSQVFLTTYSKKASSKEADTEISRH